MLKADNHHSGVWSRKLRRVLHALLWLLAIIVVIRYVTVAPRAGLEVNAGKDFNHLWLGGRMITTGHGDTLYDPQMQKVVHRQADSQGRLPAAWGQRNEKVGVFFYPPPTATAYALLGWMPLRTAAIVNAYLNVALALLVSGFLSRWLHARIPIAITVLAVLMYPACFVTLALGQNSLFTLSVVLLAWHLCDLKRDFWAGLVLGLLVLKPNWALAIGWIPLIHGRWRVLLGMACGTLALVAGTVVLVGIEPFKGYLDLSKILVSLQDLPGYRLALTYNGLSVFRKWWGIGLASNIVGWSSSVIVLLVTCWTTRGQWRPGDRRLHLLMGCCLSASLWVNPHLFYYDLMPTVACLAVMGLEWHRCGQLGRVVSALIMMSAYMAITWDESWSAGQTLPIPSLATLAVWLWFCNHISQERRRSAAAVCKTQDS